MADVTDLVNEETGFNNLSESFFTSNGVSFPFGFQQITSILPHRYPALMVDKVVSISNEEIVAQKNITVNESFFAGHFPEYPIMPGVLMIEACAQTAGIFAYYKYLHPKPSSSMEVRFAGIESVKFKKEVLPSDILMLHANNFAFKKIGESIFIKFSATAKVDGVVVMVGSMSCIVSSKVSA